MNKYLFIGGPIDGEYLDLDDGCDNVTVPSFPDVEIVFNRWPGLYFDEVIYTRKRFVAALFNDDRNEISFFVMDDMSDFDALAMLIEGYVGKKDE